MSNSDRMQNLIHHILCKGKGTEFYTFANADRKQWIIPKKNIQTAMNLYQPSGIKGKAMKCLFPYLHNISQIRAKLRVETNRYTLQKEIKELLSILYCNNHIEFALFGGTPSAHQKITIQISSGKKILGYCKITDNKEIKHIFLQEKQLLNTLQHKGVKQIPKCLFCDELMNGIALFVQSTVKTNRSVVKHEWTNAHWAFLTHLYNRTKQTLPFSQTDFAKNLATLTNNLKYLSSTKTQVLSEAITKVRDYYDDKPVEFSAYHADFTPWNMFFEKGELFVFDFEYAQTSYPPFLDYFHYFTQCCIFEKRWNEEQIFNAYQSQKKNMKAYFIKPDMSYLCYLLSVIELYLNRDKKQFEGDVNSNLNTWLSLITKLMK